MFCGQCGYENNNDSKFCSKCGKPIGQSPQDDTNYNVNIFRESQLYLVNPPMNVVIDGKQRMAIENGGTINIKLSEGKHTIMFSQALRKRSIDVDLNNDISIIVKFNRLTGSIETILS